jgi:orotidine-5'-phosphate decarboxylase
MTQDQEKYAFTDGKTPLSAAELNTRFFALVRRLHALELLSVDWASAIAQVQNHGLARINEAVVPLIEALKTDLADLIAQGREDLAAQTAAVDAKLAEVDATMETVAAAIADITARIATVEASQQQLATVTLPETLKRAKKLALILG